MPFFEAVGKTQDARSGKTTAFVKHAIYKRIDNTESRYFKAVHDFRPFRGIEMRSRHIIT
eukprot:scaffold9057_cov154-Chaetoceros_neogracile.AAC.2